MRTTTPAVDTRPSFFAFRPIRHASVVANILSEKFGPGDEANVAANDSRHDTASSQFDHSPLSRPTKATVS